MSLLEKVVVVEELGENYSGSGTGRVLEPR
jgi:hypothetical protein